MSQAGYDKLFRSTMSFLISQSIYTAAKLDVADKLGDDALPITELAEQTGADEDRLYRVMRLLANQEIFTEHPDRTFSNNEVSMHLRSDIEHSFRDYVLMINAPDGPFPTVMKLSEGVSEGTIPFDAYYGKPFFKFLGDNPELAGVFDAGMQSAHSRATDSFLEHFSLEGVSTFADIGGGKGEAVAKVLKTYPDIHGVIFDQPHVIERAAENIRKQGLEDRCELIAGDFFKEIPVASDVYFMRQISHGWSHEQNVQILRNLRASAKKGSRLLMSDCVMGEQPKFENTPFYDVLMMCVIGGRERTVEEFEQIFSEAGFEIVQVVDTGFWFGVIETKAV